MTRSATEVPEVGSAAWWAARRGEATTARQRLDVPSIVAAAVEIVDAVGLDGCTMAAIAERLGTGPASLYRHVGSRDELFQLVLDHVLGEVDTAWLASTEDTWRTWVPRLARELRDTLLRHPRIVPLVGTGQMLGPNAMLAREHATARLVVEGLDPRTATHVHLTIVHHVVGHVVVTAGGGRQTLAGRRAASAALADLPEDAFPTLRALHEQRADVGPDDEFAFALTVLLHGLEAALGGTSG